jgi:hypothetical protein
MEICAYKVAWISTRTCILIPKVSCSLAICPQSSLLQLSDRIRLKCVLRMLHCWQSRNTFLICMSVFVFFFRQVVGYGRKWSPSPHLLVYLLVLGLDIVSLYMVTNAICLVVWQMKVKIQTIMFPGMLTLFLDQMLIL